MLPIVAFGLLLIEAMAHGASPDRESASGGIESWHSTPIVVSNAKVETLEPAPSLSGRVYLAARENGVYRTDDHGRRWRHATAGLPWDVTIRDFSVCATDANRVVAGAPGTVYRTTRSRRSGVRARAVHRGTRMGRDLTEVIYHV